jgi:hypothetical protein
MKDSWRGHEINQGADGAWVYLDGSAVKDDPNRACGKCGRPNTPEGYDACLGAIQGAINACCGHGIPSAGYVQYRAEEDAAEVKE